MVLNIPKEKESIFTKIKKSISPGSNKNRAVKNIQSQTAVSDHKIQKDKIANEEEKKSEHIQKTKIQVKVPKMEKTESKKMHIQKTRVGMKATPMTKI